MSQDSLRPDSLFYKLNVDAPLILRKFAIGFLRNNFPAASHISSADEH